MDVADVAVSGDVDGTFGLESEFVASSWRRGHSGGHTALAPGGGEVGPPAPTGSSDILVVGDERGNVENPNHPSQGR